MAKVEALASFAVKFGKVTFGEGSISIPIKVERAVLGRGALNMGDKMFCGRRLTCEIRTGSETDDAERLPGMRDKDWSVAAIVECKTLSVSRRNIGTTLNFKLDAINPDTISHFASRAGSLSITAAEDLPEKKPGRPAKSDDDDDAEEGEEEE